MINFLIDSENYSSFKEWILWNYEILEFIGGRWFPNMIMID